MSFWTDLEASIAAEAKVLEADIVKAATFLKPLVEAAAADIGKAALQAVLQQAPAVLTGQEKLSAAVSSVKATLASAGKTAATSVIEAGVQEAYDQAALLAHPAS